MLDFCGGVPAREPDFHFARGSSYVSSWRGAATEGDHLIVATMPNIVGAGNAHQLQLAVAGQYEMYHTPGPHGSVLRLLGVQYETNRTRGSVSHRVVTPSADNINRRRRTLPLSIPGVTVYPDGVFADVELARELEGGNFLVTEDNSQLNGHDILFHYAGATAFYTPNAMDRLGERAKHSRHPEAAKLLVGDLEAEANATSLGRALVAASSIEVRSLTDHMVNDQKIENAWRYAGTFVTRVIGADISEAMQWGLDLRQHVLALDSAISNAERTIQPVSR